LFPRSELFGRHRELYRSDDVSRDVDYLQGACLMVRAVAIERVGGLDESFFMYFEETDWCFRMKEAGGRVRTCPSAKVVHFGGGDTGHYDERRLLYYHESLLLFYSKHHSPWERLALRVLLFKRIVIRLCVWLAIGALSPARRAAAFSSARGYRRSVRLLFGGM
jgi:GT2 family glycosyltransferase